MKQRRLQPELAGLFVGKNSREGLHTKNVVEVSVLCSGRERQWRRFDQSLDEVWSALLEPADLGSRIARICKPYPYEA